jgi:hypothetical protein
MAAGINLEGLNDRVILGLSKSQLDFQLINYYKLLATLHIENKDFDKANKALENLYNLINMRDVEERPDRDQVLLEEAKNLDKLEVRIDPESIRNIPVTGLIPKKKRK